MALKREDKDKRPKPVSWWVWGVLAYIVWEES